MANARGMTPDEARAIELIAASIYDEAFADKSLSARASFIEGFKRGRVYTINQFEDFTASFEREDR